MGNPRLKDEEDLYKLFYAFCETALNNRVDDAMALFTEPYTGVGLGEQGMVHTLAEADNILRAGYKPVEGLRVVFELQDYMVNFFGDEGAIVSAGVRIGAIMRDEEPVYSGVMQTIGARRTGDGWKISFTHASPMLLSEESIESYPLKFMDHTLSLLRTAMQQDTFDMINKNFSGGIFGTYARVPFPLYFANDRIIEMLGYTREEFEERFREDTTLMNYVEDKESMVGRSEEALESKEDYSFSTRFARKDGSYIWVEAQTRKTKDEDGNDIFISIVTDISEIVKLQQESQRQHQTIIESMQYASRIQRNLLTPEEEFQKAFSDHAILWNPKDIVGGDSYWMKRFQAGSVLCVCDCTGHGTPGALLTMMVAGVLDNVVHEGNCWDTAEIIWQIERRFVSILNVSCPDFPTDNRREIIDFHDGCELAVIFVAKDGSVTLSASNLYIFCCDGGEVRQVKGQKLRIGDGWLTSKEQVEMVTIDANPQNRFYVTTDGLCDQIGQNGKRFGYRGVKEIIASGHGQPQSAVAASIWQAFETHRGSENRRDDVTLICFQP